MDDHNRTEGYMVSLEWIEPPFLRSDLFPDIRVGNPPIPTEKEAWEMATIFASETVGRACNIYVVGLDFAPVEGCEDRAIRNR